MLISFNDGLCRPYNKPWLNNASVKLPPAWSLLDGPKANPILDFTAAHLEAQGQGAAYSADNFSQETSEALADVNSVAMLLEAAGGTRSRTAPPTSKRRNSLPVAGALSLGASLKSPRKLGGGALKGGDLGSRSLAAY